MTFFFNDPSLFLPLLLGLELNNEWILMRPEIIEKIQNSSGVTLDH